MYEIDRSAAPISKPTSVPTYVQHGACCCGVQCVSCHLSYSVPRRFGKRRLRCSRSSSCNANLSSRTTPMCRRCPPMPQGIAAQTGNSSGTQSRRSGSISSRRRYTRRGCSRTSFYSWCRQSGQVVVAAAVPGDRVSSCHICFGSMHAASSPLCLTSQWWAVLLRASWSRS
jgi:hypothetical protein